MEVNMVNSWLCSETKLHLYIHFENKFISAQNQSSSLRGRGSLNVLHGVTHSYLNNRFKIYSSSTELTI